ncbi:MAG: cache domain-containing protein [Bauldia sp.]
MIGRLVGAVLALSMFTFAAHAQERATPAEAQAMAEAAADLLATQGPEVAIAAFNTAPEWRDRDLYVFAIGIDGVTLAHVDPGQIGQSVLDLVDANGVYFVREFLAIDDRGWVDYSYTNPTTGLTEPKQSYVVRVGDVVLGVGAYAEHAARATPDEAQAMAEAAAALVETVGPEAAVEAFNTEPEWRDRDLYVFAIDETGLGLAHVDPAQIGANAIGLVDANGVHFIQEFIALEEPGWINYGFANPVTGIVEPKQSYVIHVGGIIVGVGAYAERAARGTPAEAQAMAEAAAAFLEANGLDAAAEAFTNAPEWRDRDLYVFVLDADAINLAHGGDPALVGDDIKLLVDPNGVNIGEAIIGVEDRGWVDYVYRNPENGLDEPKQTYVIHVADVFVGVGAYVPTEERATLDEAQAMAEAAAAFLEANGPEVAFPAFTDGVEWHDRDLYVFAFDLAGTCVAHGADPALIGQDLTGLADVNGTLFVLDFIAVTDGAWVPYVWANPLNGVAEPKQSYVIRVGDHVVGVGAYLP